jgi:hypothetical protein
MSEAMREALADKAELPPFELGQAAALLPHSTAAQAPALVNAAPAPAPSPPVLDASAAPSVPRRPDCPASCSRHSPTFRCFYHYKYGGYAHRLRCPAIGERKTYSSPGCHPHITIAIRCSSHLPQGSPHQHLLPGSHGGGGQPAALQFATLPLLMLVVKKFPLGNFVQKKMHFCSQSFTQNFLQAKIANPFWALIFF